MAPLGRLPDAPVWVVADRGYSSHTFREHIRDRSARPATPPRRDAAPVACPGPIYNTRSLVERHRARLKGRRAVATRQERTANSFPGVLCLVAVFDWFRR
jgi:transposase